MNIFYFFMFFQKQVIAEIEQAKERDERVLRGTLEEERASTAAFEEKSRQIEEFVKLGKELTNRLRDLEVCLLDFFYFTLLIA